MYKLKLVPDASGYNSQEGEEGVYTKLAGGAGRLRRDKVGATKMVNVSWTMNPAQYEYFRAFYATALNKGTSPFLCDLLSEDGSGAVEHTCQIIPGSLSLPQQQGLTYVQQAQLEVTPIPRDAEHDWEVILLFDNFEDEGLDWLGALAHLVNEVAPEFIGA